MAIPPKDLKIDLFDRLEWFDDKAVYCNNY